MSSFGKSSIWRRLLGQVSFLAQSTFPGFRIRGISILVPCQKSSQDWSSAEGACARDPPIEGALILGFSVRPL